MIFSRGLCVYTHSLSRPVGSLVGGATPECQDTSMPTNKTDIIQLVRQCTLKTTSGIKREAFRIGGSSLTRCRTPVSCSTGEASGGFGRKHGEHRSANKKKGPTCCWWFREICSRSFDLLPTLMRGEPAVASIEFQHVVA